MNVEDAIAKLVVEFGSEKERVWCDKITAVFVKAVGNREIPDATLTKVMTVGRSLRKLGVT